jgi:hypothetical protein
MTEQTAPTHPQEARERQRVSAQQLTDSVLSEALEVLPSKAESKFSISLKVRDSGALFRFLPARDPRQPRLWCITVRRCLVSGILDTSEPVWIDRPGRSQSDIAVAIEAIRVEIGAWLAAPTRRDLCHWLLTATPAPTVAIAMGLPKVPTSQRSH